MRRCEPGQVTAADVQELSLRRANAVKQALLRKFPTLAAEPVHDGGMGWDRPADPNDREQPRQEPARRDQSVSARSEVTAVSSRHATLRRIQMAQSLRGC